MNLKDFIRSIPDYPKKGILFRDITTLIKDQNAFSETIDQILERSKKFFNISIIIDNNKNFENIFELHTLNDIDRNLLSSEGRSYIGKWWHLSPK